MTTPTTHTCTITQKPATGNGDIDGFEIVCTCGYRWTSSILSMANNEAYEHFEYHKRTAITGNRSKKSARG